MKILRDVKTYCELVKIAHTIFALPYALSALVLAYLCGFGISAKTAFWVVAAFTAARSAAMGFNRLVDIRYDALNPRTKQRPSVTGAIPPVKIAVFTFMSACALVFCAYMINTLCFVLSFPALAAVCGYSYFKRFSWTAHYALGFALACAPAGAWIAASGSFDPRILSLCGVLFFSIAGFDIVYALQDADFDVKNGLHSVPSRFGKKMAAVFAGGSFGAAVLFMVLTGALFKLNIAYFCAVVFLAAEYLAGILTVVFCGLKRVNLVFFYMNASISLLIFLAIASNLFF